MPTKIYDTETVFLIDGTELYLTPLKIKYLREFMDAFEKIKATKDDDEALSALVNCVRIAMKQYHPIIKTIEQLEDSIDIRTIYKVLDVAGGIKMNEQSSDQPAPIQQQATTSKSSWEDLDLAKLESEVFLLGIWKDYEDLETSLSMPELLATLEIKRELDYSEKKFLAAMQGVDLENATGEPDAWERLKAKVASGGVATSTNDILAYQGIEAQKAGFGIGMGIDYEKS